MEPVDNEDLYAVEHEVAFSRSKGALLARGPHQVDLATLLHHLPLLPRLVLPDPPPPGHGRALRVLYNAQCGELERTQRALFHQLCLELLTLAKQERFGVTATYTKYGAPKEHQWVDIKFVCTWLQWRLPPVSARLVGNFDWGRLTRRVWIAWRAPLVAEAAELRAKKRKLDAILARERKPTLVHVLKKHRFV